MCFSRAQVLMTDRQKLLIVEKCGTRPLTSPNFLINRSFISRAAAFVKVMVRILRGSIPTTWSR